MQLIKNKNFDENHSAMVIDVKEFIPHSNADKLKCCKVGTYNIITGIDSEPGLYVYFQKESKINPEFLSYASLYKHSELNFNPNETGMFEDSGRIKVIKLRGELSEGFIIPAVKFENWITSVTNKDIKLEAGMEFNALEDNGKEFWIIKKYVPFKQFKVSEKSKVRTKVSKKLQDRVIPEQFRFHYTTVVIKKCPNVIQPNDIINISEKIHGTSGISANVLCKTYPKNLWKKLGYWVVNKIINPVFKFTLSGVHYYNLYASRTVIKNKYINENVSDGCDVWAKANEIVGPKLPKGWTAYYEIVGYLPNGSYIQKNYDYGCVPPIEGEVYTPEKHFKVRIYRLTITNIDGYVYELTPSEVNNWCERNELKAVNTWYEGPAKDLYPELDTKNHWNENFVDTLSNEKLFYMEELSPSCENKVPHEGLVIKVLGRNSEAFKLKCFKFLDKEQKEMDKGTIDIENEA